MATPAARLIRDQNLDIHFPGGATLGGKTDGFKAQKKGGIGPRKALNDISNSSKASALQAAKKNNSSNVIAIENDIAAAAKTPFSVGGKPNGSKAPQKGQSGVRKALSDLTNSGKPSLHQVPKKSQDTKLSAILEENADINAKEEGFLHNHQECIKAREKIMDKESFFKLVVPNDGPPLQPSSKVRPESPPRHLEMVEMPVPPLEGPVLDHGRRKPGLYSPACLSPISPRLSSYWKELDEDKLHDFALVESPKLPKY